MRCASVGSSGLKVDAIDSAKFCTTEKQTTLEESSFERASQSRECSAFSALLSLDDEA